MYLDIYYIKISTKCSDERQDSKLAFKISKSSHFLMPWAQQFISMLISSLLVLFDTMNKWRKYETSFDMSLSYSSLWEKGRPLWNTEVCYSQNTANLSTCLSTCTRKTQFKNAVNIKSLLIVSLLIQFPTTNHVHTVSMFSQDNFTLIFFVCLLLNKDSFLCYPLLVYLVSQFLCYMGLVYLWIVNDARSSPYLASSNMLSNWI